MIFSSRAMENLENIAPFPTNRRRSLHIAKYRNEHKSARFPIVIDFQSANLQLADIQSKFFLSEL